MSTEESAQSTVEHGKPTEFMSCLVTMEDITDENYVEYQCYPSMKWKPAQFEQSVVEQVRWWISKVQDLLWNIIII